MPYTVQTKDGITLQNIPDDVAPDSQEVQTRVQTARANRDMPMASSHGAPAPNRAMLDMSPVPPQMVASHGVPADATPPSTTLTGLAGAGVRGLAPITAGATLGALAGLPIGGVGAIPGAAAGAAAVGGAQLLGDPLVMGINKMFGTNYTLPTEALQHMMTSLGVPEPKTAAERIVQAATATAAGAGGQLGLGQSLAREGFSASKQMVGLAMASQPGALLAGGAGGGAASQATAEAGGGMIPQMMAGLAGAALAGAPFAKPMPRGPAAAVEAVPAEAAAMAGPEATVAETALPRPAEPIPAAIPEPAPVVPKEIPQADLGTLIKKASGTGVGAASAKQQIADMAAVNPEAQAAAGRLGIDLPPDVFSDNPQIRAAAGLTRSAAGSPAEGAWRTTVTNAVDQADTVIKGLDANFTEGQASPGVVSQKVRDSLVQTRQTNADAASQIYQQVDAAIPKNTPVALPKLQDTLLTIMDEVGEGLSTQEKRLVKMVDDPNVTYGRLIREKNLIGQAIAGKDSPYGNMEASALKRLYAALADDQMTNVAKIGSPELQQQLQGANLIYSKNVALGKLIVSTFGDETAGSIAGKMRSAISDSTKGGSADFAKLMAVVPDDLKREVVATALASSTRSMRGAERGGFGFDEFAKTYRGLRANAPVYKQIVDVLGPESHQVMQDLYAVSKRITDARASVLVTGKANQAMLNSIKAEGLVSQTLNSTVAKGAATAVSAVGLGPVGAGVTSALMNALSSGKKDALVAAGEMFNSEEFKRLVVEAASKPTVGAAPVKALATSGGFSKFAKLTNLPEDQRFNWIMNALRAENATKETP